MLCNFCTKAIESNQSWDYHQPSLSDLQSSAGCPFCSRLRQDVERCIATPSPSPDAASWPLYRWSVRRLGRIRETSDVAVVTFRPIIPPRDDDHDGDGSGHGQDQRTKLALSERAFYLFPEEDLGHLPYGPELGRTTDPRHAGQQIRKWMEQCATEHPGCRVQHRGGQFVPRRLLLLDAPDRGRIRVVNTAEHDVKEPYITLSHCWGTRPFVQLTVENEEEFRKEGVPWSELPENFKHAVEVGRFLGIKYIWIDSLCIVQGADGDFQAQAPLMHLVYRNSYCNITAADSPDSGGGLFRPRNADEILPIRYRAEGTSAMFGNKTWRILPEDLWDANLLRSVIYTRGWVFQERMLAPRLLHFAHQQVFWDCATMSACEALPSGLPQALDTVAGTDRRWRGRLQESGSLAHRPLAGPRDDSLEQFWKSSVRRYTVCFLSKGEDKLMAIWGIAKLVRDALEEEYGAGLWEKSLEEQLAWRVVDCRLDERPRELMNNPSWTWASMSGAVEVQDRLPEDRSYVIKDHAGRPIAFELVERKYPRQEEKLSELWDVEIPAMGQRTRLPERKQHASRAVREGINQSANKNSTHSDVAEPFLSSSIASGNRDQHPALRSKFIPIQGHISHARLRNSSTAKKWTLELDEGANFDEGDGELEVFPDVKPKLVGPGNAHSYFVVLAASKAMWNRKLAPSGSPYTGDDLEDVRYSGVGITLEPRGPERHYYRTGALHFRDIGASMWTRLQTTYCRETASPDEYDDVKGLKFWLR